MKYSLRNLTSLWKEYHGMVHTNHSTPCDACPGDPCSTEAFLKWLQKLEDTKRQITSTAKRPE